MIFELLLPTLYSCSICGPIDLQFWPRMPPVASCSHLPCGVAELQHTDAIQVLLQQRQTPIRLAERPTSNSGAGAGGGEEGMGTLPTSKDILINV